MVVCKRQEFVSDSSAHCKAKVREPAQWDSGEISFPGCGLQPPCILTFGRGEGALWGPFIRAQVSS